jgi:diguanylate cyclase (GGDEF)-like protein
MRADGDITTTTHGRTERPLRGARSLIAAIAPEAAKSDTNRWIPRLVLAPLVVLAIGIVIDLAYLITGVGGHGIRNFLTGPLVPIGMLSCLAPVIARWVTAREDQRTGWLFVVGGVGSYTIASILWNTWLEFLPHPPNPSIADILWKLSYVLIACAITGAGSRNVRRGATLRFWLDAVIAGTATAAITTAFILPPLARSAGSYAAVRNDFQYPIADSVLLVLAVSVVAARGWRLDRRWGMTIAAILILLGTDCGWTVEIVNGATTGSSADVLGYLLAFGCVGLAVWQPAGKAKVISGPRWATLIVPVIFMLVSPAILVIDHFSRVTLTAFVLTMTSLIAAVLRLALATRDMVELGDIRHVAMTDELTQLPNRREFNLRLREGTAAVAMGDGTVTAMMLDLDNFKQLNDTLGHDAGDELLRMIGPRLKRATQPGDLVARLGGDEFAILLTPGARPAEAAQAVLDSLAEPFHVAGLALRLTASLGLAAFPDDADSPEGLLKCADVAMYDAKRSRRGWEHYASERDQYTRERLELSGALAEAIDNEKIEAVFQPIVDTVTRRIVGTEALARWRQADGSLQGPGDFLEAAELAGLSRPLTRRMLDLALSRVAEWRGLGHELFVSVNATVADLLDETFPNEVVAALSIYGVCPEALSIEVTEHSILANPARIGSVLERLRRVGVKIALDDFGTGYSSLTHLRELPVDQITIDRSFVSRMADQKADAAIVYATIELVHRLGLEVVAEGVEDEATWQALAELGSERIQGYACSRPLEPAAFGALLGAQGPDHFAESQSLPTPASTASRGSIS